MAEKTRVYFVIDMKSFFASVECAERGLNPFETCLVVADKARSRGTVCLAVTPKMKELGLEIGVGFMKYQQRLNTLLQSLE